MPDCLSRFLIFPSCHLSCSARWSNSFFTPATVCVIVVTQASMVFSGDSTYMSAGSVTFQCKQILVQEYAGILRQLFRSFDFVLLIRKGHLLNLANSLSHERQYLQSECSTCYSSPLALEVPGFQLLWAVFFASQLAREPAGFLC